MLFAACVVLLACVGGLTILASACACGGFRLSFLLDCYKETQWEAGRHKEEQEQETMKATRTGV